MKKTIIKSLLGTLLAATLLVPAACTSGRTALDAQEPFSATANAPETATANPRLPPPPTKSLGVEAKVDRKKYLPGDTVRIDLTLTNVTGDPVIVGEFPPRTVISRYGQVFRTIEQVGQELELRPGQTVNYGVSWDQKDENGEQVLPASSYQVAVENVTVTKGNSSVQESYHELTAIQIDYPQGTLEKAIDVSNSARADGITITLTKIESSAEQMRVYLIKTPGYATETGILEPPSFRGRADITGAYRFDDGSALNTVSFGYREVSGGVEYEFEFLYPPPSDAKVLHFSIETFSMPGVGEYGPFEFEVPLR